MSREIAERAGEVLGKMKGSKRAAGDRLLLVDAIVVVTAAARGDVIHTSDVHDLERLRTAGSYDVKIFGI